MNKKLLISLTFILITGLAITFYVSIAKQNKREPIILTASNQADFIRYLDKKFKEENIPVVERTVLEKSPLRLRIVVRSADEWTGTDDMVIMNSVERIVFIDARREGYIVENLVSILQDSQGEQLDYTEMGADHKQLDHILARDTSWWRLSDKKTKALLMKKIDPFLGEYHLHDVPFTLEVSSKDRNQTVNLELQTSSLDVANNAAFFFWTLPHFALFNEVNAAGANIVLYRAKIIDENGANLLDLTYDFQLGSGGWTQSEKLIELGEGPPR